MRRQNSVLPGATVWKPGKTRYSLERPFENPVKLGRTKGKPGNVKKNSVKARKQPNMRRQNSVTPRVMVWKPGKTRYSLERPFENPVKLGRTKGKRGNVKKNSVKARKQGNMCRQNSVTPRGMVGKPGKTR